MARSGGSFRASSPAYAGGREYTRAGQDFYVGRKHVREVVNFVAPRWRIAEHSFRAGRRQFQRVWLGIVIMGLWPSLTASARLGLVDFDARSPRLFALSRGIRFLGMGPVTIAGSYGPVTDHAQSVYELSHYRADAGARGPRSSRTMAFDRPTSSAPSTCSRRTTGRPHLQVDGQAVLIGTARGGS